MLYRCDIEKLEAIERYIDANLGEELNVQRISICFGIAESTLRRNFASYFRIPIYRYIRERRLRKAFVLLKEKEARVSEVALLVGYKEASAFSHAFTRFYGFSPNCLVAGE